MRLNTGDIKRTVLLGMALLLVTAGPAAAFTYNVGQGWQELNFDILTPAAYGGGYGGTLDDPNDPFSPINTPWTFTLTVESIMRFADIGDKGDYYRIWDNGAELLTTPMVDFEMNGETDPGVTFPDGTWSTAMVNLAPGAYSLNFQDMVFESGDFGNLPQWFEGAATACFRVDPVPEPAGLALLGLGLVGLAMAYRRRTQS